MRKSTNELQQMNLWLHRESKKVGLKMNMMKTKVLFNNYIILVDNTMFWKVISHYHQIECIRSVLTYGSETWSFMKALERKLWNVLRGIERIMLGITSRDKKRASWIKEQTKVEDILTAIKRKKGTWTRHVMRQTDNRWTVSVAKWQPRDIKRRQDRQINKWRDDKFF